jgi:hypothetical protein
MLRRILKEITQLTGKLIECGLAVNQNFPRENDGFVTWSKQKNLSIALKNIDYREIYKELNNTKNYNIKMIDGALIQMLYTFSKKEIISHTLAFYPSPNLERYEDNIEDYEEYYYGEGVYANIILKHIVSFPLRFDYSPKQYVDVVHPSVHMHLGLYKDCRIPVSTPLTPNVYIGFLLRNFYSSAFKEHFHKYNFNSIKLARTITEKEERLLHINRN